MVSDEVPEEVSIAVPEEVFTGVPEEDEIAAGFGGCLPKQVFSCRAAGATEDKTLLWLSVPKDSDKESCGLCDSPRLRFFYEGRRQSFFSRGDQLVFYEVQSAASRPLSSSFWSEANENRRVKEETEIETIKVLMLYFLVLYISRLKELQSWRVKGNRGLQSSTRNIICSICLVLADVV